MMGRRIVAVIAVVVPILWALAATGCGSNEIWSADEFDPAETTTWVIVADLSQSTRQYRGDFVQAVRELLPSMEPGDRLTVLSVEKTAVKDARYLYQTTLPHFTFTPSAAPRDDNELLVDSYNAKEQERYEAELAEWESTQDPAAFEAEVLAAVERPMLKSVSSPSDLFGGLDLAGGILSTAPGPKRLVILSDGQAYYPSQDGAQGEGGNARATVDWRDKIVTDKDVDRVVRAQTREDSLPQLAGAKVFMIGLNADDAKRFAALRHAWVRYIEAVGGQIAKEDVLRRIEVFRLQAWLEQS